MFLFLIKNGSNSNSGSLLLFYITVFPKTCKDVSVNLCKLKFVNIATTITFAMLRRIKIIRIYKNNRISQGLVSYRIFLPISGELESVAFHTTIVFCRELSWFGAQGLTHRCTNTFNPSCLPRL